jgi:hypothetical protein
MRDLLPPDSREARKEKGRAMRGLDMASWLRGQRE